MQRHTLDASSIAVAVLAFQLAGCSSPAEAQPLPADPLVSVPTTQVVSRQVPRQLVLTGTLAANRESVVAADAAGKVVKTFAERGDSVLGGKPLARLDASEAALSQSEARARAGAARAEREHARLECDRAERLFAERVISRSEYDRNRAGCETAEWSSAAADVRERISGKSIGDATIRAPFAGVVAERHVTVGEYVGPGARIATVVELDPLRLEIAVPEHAVRAVKQNQNVSFTVPAYPNQRFSGNIRYLGAALRRSGRDMVVEAVVPNGDRRLRPGMFATLQIEIGSAQAAVIPASALTGTGRSRRAFAVRNGHLEERVVLVADDLIVDDAFAATPSNVALVSGLEPGEQIAALITPEVKDGARVQ
jgi:membrane fusion protein, multidrug efflux system